MSLAGRVLQGAGPSAAGGVPWWITILLGVLTITLPMAAYFASTRATRLQVQATSADAEANREAGRIAVDAQAYDRARVLYEAAINVLRNQIEDLTERVASLSDEVHRLRAANEKLEKEVVRWRSSADNLSHELEMLRGK